MVDERLEQARRRLRVDPSDDEIAAWLMEQRRVGRPYRFGHVETLAPSMWRACEAARGLLSFSRPLLILGEAGSGRTRLARSVHDLGPRSAKPWFASETCSGLSRADMERELFGSGQGADRRPGLFAIAAGGTLLLRDIDDAGETLSQVLGRVLHDGVYRRAGERDLVPFDVRVLLTASGPCPGLVGACDVVPVPSLRSRPEDALLAGE